MVLFAHPIKMYGWCKVEFHSFLASALDSSERLVSRIRLPPHLPVAQWTGCFMASRAGNGISKNGISTLSLESKARRSIPYSRHFTKLLLKLKHLTQISRGPPSPPPEHEVAGDLKIKLLIRYDPVYSGGYRATFMGWMLQVGIALKMDVGGASEVMVSL